MIPIRYLHRRTWLNLSCGMTLGSLLPSRVGKDVIQAADENAVNPKIKSLIWLFMQGGPSHLESFDPKPEGSTDTRGEFSAIDTSIPGVKFCEHLPKFSRLVDQCVLFRGMSHNLADHRLGSKYLLTGNRPRQITEYPDIGSVCNKELTTESGFPRSVTIPSNYLGPGHLGVEYSPWQTVRFPRIGESFAPRGIRLTDKEDIAVYQRRSRLLKNLDRTFDLPGYSTATLQGLNRFSNETEELLMNPTVADAFDIGRESDTITRMFGMSDFDAGCLLAVRLVKAGVRCVTIDAGTWDTHADNFEIMKNQLLPKLDSCASGLIAALKAKDLWDTTAVFIGGEFGRTPQINQNAGRDHHPRCMSLLLTGGVFKGGLCLGQSDKNGFDPTGEDFSPPDILATLYSGLGIDVRKEYQVTRSRSIPLMTEGRLLNEIFS